MKAFSLSGLIGLLLIYCCAAQGCTERGDEAAPQEHSRGTQPVHDDEHSDDEEHGHDDEHADDGDHANGDDHGHGDEHAHEHADDEPDSISFSREQQQSVTLRTQDVEVRTIRPTVRAFARLARPSGSAATLIAPATGRIAPAGPAFPAIGDAVGEGEVLFLLSPALSEDQDPASLDLEIDRARIHVAAAEREVNRLEPLVREGVVAQRRLDAARSQLEEANAEYRTAQRHRRHLRESQELGSDGDGVRIPSPVGGTISALTVTAGSWVQAGQPIAEVVGLGDLWLDVALPEAYVGRLRSISGVWFQLDDGSEVVELPRGALVSVGVELDATTRTLPIRFAVSNEAGNLYAGMTTLANLVVEQPREAVAVMRSAVVDDSGVDVVYVRTDGERFVRRPVRPGVRDGDYVEVVDGLQAGEEVVVAGAWSLKLASMAPDSMGHGHAH